MPPRRRIPLAAGRAAVEACRAAGFEPGAFDPQTLAIAVRFTVEELVTKAPGRAVEVRVPPYAVGQCLEGPTHTRGTPPGVVETYPLTWLRCACGDLSWRDAIADGAIRASGQRADLAPWLPLV